ncbi:MAG: hypothetical protein PHE79_04440 [Eubacteriales bacterium]|nr:hypothetical protein [Eubacteriales bacterium]
MQKDFTIEQLQKIIAKAPLKKSIRRKKLVERLFKEIEPYLLKDISTVEEELDFCSLVELVLDKGGVGGPDARVDTLGQIYDAIGFTHFWKG